MRKVLMIAMMLIMAAAYSAAWSDPAGGRYIVCWDQRMINTILGKVCDGPQDVSDSVNKDQYSCPGGRGKGFKSHDDAMSWMRQNCNY
jgi:hypothetical protein